MSTGWFTQEFEGEVHVLPNDDVVWHDPVDCACQPETKPVPREDGSMGWLVTHAAWDGRK